MKKITEIISIILLCLTGITLVGLQLKPLGWYVWILGFISLFANNKGFRKNFFLIFLSIAILGISPIDTDVSVVSMLTMGFFMILAIAIPYVISRYVYKEHLVKFKWHHGRNWVKKEVAYIFITVIISYFLLPFYLKSTGAMYNWTSYPDISHTIRLFIGTNALGIWDELFFVSTVLGILRKYMSFFYANLVQAVLFTSFLYELGFTSWGFIMIFIFALIQGIIFRKTESLFYVITIHLSLDLVLFLAIVNSHVPGWFNIFIT